MRYLAQRLLHATLLLLAISFFSFALLELAPGDYFDSMRLNPEVSRQALAGMRSQYGLDQPLPVRYGHWLAALLHGQLGVSLASRGPVAPVLRVRARNTLILSGTATLFAWLLALPIGIWSATKRNGWADRIWGATTSALLTIPPC
jgi:peptide/nickel transport system permease protein